MLLRLNAGIFALHFVLMSNFLVLPVLLRDVVGLEGSSHWQVYLPLMFFSFVVMLPAMVLAEKKQQVKPVFVGAIAILAATMFLLAGFHHGRIPVLALYFLFFAAFNLLEALLPSLVSKTAPAGARGTAMGIYSTGQFLGLGCGGVLGGLILQYSNASWLYLLDGVITCAWFFYALGMAKLLPLKNLTLSLKQADDAVADKLLRIAGVHEVMVDTEQRRAYLKVNEKELDRAALDALAG
jgi:MFS family permease